MDNAVDVWVLFEYLVKRAGYGNIDIVEIWLLAADELDTIHSFLRRVVEVVRDDNFVISLQKSQGSERANIAGSAVFELGRKTQVAGACIPCY